MRLSEVKTGETAIIVKILGHGAFRKRVMEMGFVGGKRVEVLLNAPLHDPIKYKILDYEVSLRRAEAELIEVVPDDGETETLSHLNVIRDNDPVEWVRRESKNINVVLIGNPNCGKTSIFNYVSGQRGHVGNYSGVTVDASEGEFEYKGYHINIVDLPGTYSLSAYSPEEIYVRRYLKDRIPDVIVNVVVSSNIERNLYLSTELIDMDRSMVIALNMYDELEKSGCSLDYKTLGKMIGVPMVPTISKTGEGINQLLDNIVSVYEHTHDTVRHVHVNLGGDIEEAIKSLKDEIKKNRDILPQFSPRYIAIKLLERDKEIEDSLKDSPHYSKLIAMRDREVKHIEKDHDGDVSSIIASEKYGFIAGALRETYQLPEEKQTDKTFIIDSIVTSKLLGFPIFIVIMWLMFWATFNLGAYPMEWIQALVDFVGDLIRHNMPSGPLKDLIVDGIIGGVGGVIVFLPNIMLLYFFISFMEDSGYMARAAFIMDKLMHKIGLHGKSFIPLIMGFGCNVPAIIATRSIESKSSRLITILINPFMSCGARLPVYIMFVTAFFPNNSALVLLSLYLLGIVVAMLTARLLRNFWFKKDETPFVMELPPYRMPTMKSSLLHMWDKGKQYLRKMGGVILLASIIVWTLNYFPRDLNVSSDEMTPQQIVEQQENSYLGQVGKFITPVVEPLGMNWKMSIALISGTSAKEIILSTLAVLYPDEGTSEESSLSQRLQKIGAESDSTEFSPLIALSFMVFVLLCFPCIASIVAIVKETGSWKYGLFSVVYNTSVAWLMAFLVYNLGTILMC